MGDLSQDEGFGGSGTVDALGDDGWDEGEENLETDVEDGFDDPEETDLEDLGADED